MKFEAFWAGDWEKVKQPRDLVGGVLLVFWVAKRYLAGMK